HAAVEIELTAPVRTDATSASNDWRDFICVGSDTAKLASPWIWNSESEIFRGAPASRRLPSASRRGLPRRRRDADVGPRDACAPRKGYGIASVSGNAPELAPGIFTSRNRGPGFWFARSGLGTSRSTFKWA